LIFRTLEHFKAKLKLMAKDTEDQKMFKAIKIYDLMIQEKTYVFFARLTFFLTGRVND